LISIQRIAIKISSYAVENPSLSDYYLVPGGVNLFQSRQILYVSAVQKLRNRWRKFPDEFRIGNVYSIVVFGLDYENIEYGYRMDGPLIPRLLV